MNRSIALTLATAHFFSANRSSANNYGTVGISGNFNESTSAAFMQPGALAGSSDFSILVSADDSIKTRVEYTPSLNPLGDWSCEIWVKPTMIPGQLSCPFSSGNFGIPRSGWLIYMDHLNGWSFRGYQNNDTSVAYQIDTNSGPPTAGIWYHLVMTWNSAAGTAKAYVNGTLAGEQSGITNFVPTSAPGAVNGALHIGSRSDSAFGWSGYADEAAVYGTTLTSQQVSDHYQNGINPTRGIPYNVLVQQLSPVGYWRLNEASFDLQFTPPVDPVVIKSAAMRGATGLMDIVFRVNDPDDATVKTRALAFIDGQRSFAKLIKPTTFAEGTGSKIGDAIATNTDHTLTWNVAADWNIDLGQIKFEILAMDNRGLLPLDWVTIPAANGQPELTISKNAPSEQEVLDALLWQYASGDPGLKLENGVLKGSASSGVFSNTALYQGDDEQIHAPVYALKQMNLSAGGTSDVRNATAARASISDADRWHVIKKPDGAFRIIAGAWGYSDYGLLSFPQIRDSITTIAVGHSHGLCLQKGGAVSAWGSNDYGKSSVPPSLVDVIGIAAGGNHSLALKADGTVIAWGANHDGQSDTPNALPFVKAIAAGTAHSIALTNSGMVIGWGRNIEGQVTIPSNLPEVTEIAASNYTNLAITINRTIVAWGSNLYGQCNVPADLSDVIKVAVGGPHCLALKADGTVRAWGLNHHGQCNVPAGLPKVIAIAAGESFSLALTINGDVVGWGDSQFGQATIPSDLGSVTAIAAGGINGFAMKGTP